ncbi:MAG: gliding motility-associated C-terminal domain-containing protein, partial [Bacteroidetes bacterium]|nr:gliding motility-associated C-terminal domain-containing protein [Bacteroidota bacterium]
ITGTPSVSGPFNYTVTLTGGCGVVTAVGTITVNALPILPIESVDCTLGSGNAVISVTSPLGANYTYSLNGGPFQAGTSWSGQANGSYTITVRNTTTGCEITGASFSVNCGCANGPLLTLNSLSGSTCVSSPITITGNTFGGSATNVTITENGAGTVNPITSGTSPFSFTYTPAAGDAGNIVIITVTTNNPLGSPCVAATATYSLTVNPSPTMTSANAQTICSGNAVNIPLTSSVPSTYSWIATANANITGESTTAQSTGTINDNLVNTTTSVLTVVYNVTPTATTGGCIGTPQTVNVTVNPTPTMTSSNAQTICSGAGVNIPLTSSVASGYSWVATANANITGESTTAQVTGTINDNLVNTTAVVQTVVYTVTPTSTSGGCAGSPQTVSVTVNPSPIINIVSNPANDTICSGSSITLTASGGTSYLWSTTATTSSITEIPLSSTIYTVSVGLSGCSNTASVSVIVNPTPIISVSPNPATLCSGASTNLTATGANTYSWSPAAGLSATAGSVVSANPGLNSSYTVIGTSNGCSDTTIAIVNVNSAIVAFAGNDTTICSGSIVNLLATGGTGYVWSPATGLSCTNCQNPIATPTVTTTYSVVVSSGSCAPATANITITVDPAPVITMSSDTMICLGDSTTLSASGGLNYSWSPAIGLSCTNCPNPNASPTIATTYFVTVTNATGCSSIDSVTVGIATSITANAGLDTAICSGNSVNLLATGGIVYNWSPASGLSCTNCANPIANPVTTTIYTVTVSGGSCGSATDEVVVTVTPTPNVSIIGDTVICTGTSANLTASGGTTYLWSDGNSTAAINVSPTIPTTYTVTATNSGCSSTASINVDINNPLFASAGADVNINIGETTQLQATGGVSYSWSPPTALSCVNCSNPVASPLTTTTYYLTSWNSSGCANYDTLTVFVDAECGEVFVPSAFSPNGDNENDVLFVRGNCISEMEFVVYDRWGEKVYQSSDKSNSWDGYYKGSPMNAQVFVYYLTATLYNGETVKKQGNISLIK